MYQCIYLCELLPVWMGEENQTNNTFEYIAGLGHRPPPQPSHLPYESSWKNKVGLWFPSSDFFDFLSQAENGWMNECMLHPSETPKPPPAPEPASPCDL